MLTLSDLCCLDCTSILNCRHIALQPHTHTHTPSSPRLCGLFSLRHAFVSRWEVKGKASHLPTSSLYPTAGGSSVHVAHTLALSTRFSLKLKPRLLARTLGLSLLHWTLCSPVEIPHGQSVPPFPWPRATYPCVRISVAS